MYVKKLLSMIDPKRFIIVDDDRSNNLICKCSLKRFSADTEILSFLEPEVALQYIEDSYISSEPQIPTVIFLDINMPVLTGWDFLNIFRKFPAEVQEQFSIFMLTSSIDVRDQNKAESDLLVNGFLRKPLTTQAVFDVVNQK